MVRYVIRPKHILSTPRSLKTAFPAKATKSVGANFLFDYADDFLFACPDPTRIKNVPFGYGKLHQFYTSHKQQQRALLTLEGFPIPRTRAIAGFWNESEPTAPFIVRPLRHFGGRDYRLTQDHRDYNPTTEYISELYPKTHEYRIITVYGKPCLTLVKRVPEELSNQLPWNHANGSTFVTVSNPSADRLRYTDIYDRIANSELIKTAHILAVDVLIKPGERNSRRWAYTVCEINFSPSLSIQTNIDKVVEYVLDARK